MIFYFKISSHICFCCISTTTLVCLWDICAASLLLPTAMGSVFTPHKEGGKHCWPDLTPSHFTVRKIQNKLCGFSTQRTGHIFILSHPLCVSSGQLGQSFPGDCQSKQRKFKQAETPESCSWRDAWRTQTEYLLNQCIYGMMEAPNRPNKKEEEGEGGGGRLLFSFVMSPTGRKHIVHYMKDTSTCSGEVFPFSVWGLRTGEDVAQ